MKKVRRVTSGDMISADLLTEILVRLPVKSLLRCKSVSKPWLSLISNPNFTISHIKHTITTPGADQTLLVYGADDDSISLFNLDSHEIEAPLGFPFSRGDFPFDPYFQIVGASNGIVCVSVSYCPRDIDNNLEYFSKNIYNCNNPNIYLWNPATKHSKLIPTSILGIEDLSVAIGFGFDPICNDFKVLRILDSPNKPLSTVVYSANMNAWHMVEPNLTDNLKYTDFDVCVNGLLCCIGLDGMMAFDFNKEVFTCRVRLPIKSFLNCITDFNDSIAVITSEENVWNYNFKLWKLDDEACLRGSGDEASWTLKLDIAVEYPRTHVYGCFNNGEFLLYTDDWLLYNSHKKEARNVPVSINIHRQIIKYSESLVSITGSKQVDWIAHADDS